MTQTTNFQLNQWSGTDYVRRTDFNADNLKIDTALGQLLPRGCILLWSGAADAIPAGFALCDGENGTPDLRGRFVVGAGNSDYPVGATGGTAVEELTDFMRTGGSVMEHFRAYTSATHDNRPPYYALCYIMRV